MTFDDRGGEDMGEKNSQSFCLHRLGSIQREQGSRDVEKKKIFVFNYQEPFMTFDDRGGEDMGK